MNPESSNPVSEATSFTQAPVASPYRAGMTCMVCKEPIADNYYDVSGRIVCDQCRDDIIDRLHGGSGPWRFSKAVLFGVAAMFAGAAGYAAVLTATQLELSIVTIAIGMLIGAAVKKGCRGRGGWLYQGLAVVLTYCAIVNAYLFVGIIGIIQNPNRHRPLPAQPPAAQAARADAAKELAVKQPPRVADKTDARADRDTEAPNLIGILGLLVILFGHVFMLPVQLASKNLIILFIYGVGLMAAWQANRAPQVEVSGPFRVGEAANI